MSQLTDANGNAHERFRSGKGRRGVDMVRPLYVP